ncbi:hypothetical protein ACSBR2_002189 [Camellia fascicularis]
MASKNPPIWSGINPNFAPNYEERALGKATEALPLLAFSNWAWQMQSHSVVLKSTVVVCIAFFI